jgi:hypothetical protein
MDFEQKKLQLEECKESEIEEEKWLDLLVTVIISYKDSERREKKAIKIFNALVRKNNFLQ